MIENDEKWESVSIVVRMREKIPSTTNALESFHGHLNSHIPRRNTFWNSLYRLSQNLILKGDNIQEQINHNYYTEKRQTLSHGFRLRERIKDEIKHYFTTIDQYNCSGNKLLSCILGVDVPCRHRIYIGVEFLDCPIVKIEKKAEWNELIVETNPLEDEKVVEQISLESFDIEYITEMIHGYSKIKNRQKIEEYVHPLYNEMKQKHEELYINDIPSFMLRAIQIGIEHFFYCESTKR